VGKNNTDVRDFLVTRRARITPQQAGLQFYGGNRRMPGLRREEVAMLAGVSADYYTRLEKGNLVGVSDPRHQSPRPRPVLTGLRQPGQPVQPGPVQFLRPRRPRFLPRLRGLRPHHRRAAAHRGGPRPVQSLPEQPDRRPFHPQQLLASWAATHQAEDSQSHRSDAL
jgi:hypothetical protein